MTTPDPDYARLMRDIFPPAGDDERLGKYILKRKIARGGMGCVYEAQDPDLNRSIALKVLHDDEPDTVLRLHREAAIAAQLRHPNIVAVHEVGVACDSRGENVHFIAMDLIEGGTLADLADRPLDERLRILEETARAVAHAHGHGVIHRDLKPANVLVDPGGRVLLADFGLAVAESLQTRMTQSGAIMGTPYYMAPEQADARAAEIDARTDVYALGVMLYEILTGHLPHTGDTPAKLYSQILHEEPKRPRHVPRDLEVLCLKAMAKERSRRYPTALEFSNDLGRFRKGEPIEARPPSWIYRVRKKLAKRKKLLAVAGLAALVAVVAATAVVLTVTRANEFDRNRERAEQAYAAGEWEKTLALTHQALEIRDDEALRRIAENCSARLAREEARRRLREQKILPLIARIRETRPFFYIANIDIREKLAGVEMALEELEAIAKNPAYADYADLWKHLGMGWYFAGDSRRAEEALLRADPQNEEVSFYLGRICLEASMLAILMHGDGPVDRTREKAKAWSDRAASHLERVRAKTDSAELERRLLSAYKLWVAGRLQETVRACEEGLARFGERPGSEEFWNLLGWVERGEESVRCYDRAIERMPGYAWAYFMRGARRSERSAAIRDYTEAIRINPKLAGAFFNRGCARHALGDLEGAVADYGEMIRLAPEFSDAYYNRGNVYKDRAGRLGRSPEANPLWTAAAADYDAAIRRNPDHADAYLNRGAVREVQGDLDAAISDYSSAIRIRPRLAEAYHNRANARLGRNDISGAIEDYTAAIEIRPDFPEAHNNRGMARQLRKDLAGALSDFSEAIRLSPEYGEAYFNRAVARTETRDYEGAAADYSVWIRLHPTDYETYYHRASVLEKAGRLREAILDLTETLKLAPRDWPYRATTERKLADLRLRLRNAPRD